MIRGNRVSLTPQAGDVSDRVATTQFVNTQSANFLTTNGNQTIIGGFGEQTANLGTISSGTLTPTPFNNLMQCILNAGAFTVAAPATAGNIALYITNTTNASTLTFAGFTKQFSGDAYTWTVGNEYALFIYCWQNALGTTRSAYVIKAMQ